MSHHIPLKEGTRMRHLKLFFVACLTIFSLGFITQASADDIPTTAPPTGIYDPHHYLNESVTQKLIGLNSIYQQTKLKPQLGVVIVPNIHGYSGDNLEATATKIANDWKIGYNDSKVGFLVLISVDTHDIYTLPSKNAKIAFDEQGIADLNSTIISDFRNQNYSQDVLNYLSSYQNLIQKNSNKTLDQIKKEKKEADVKRKEATKNTLIALTGAGLFIGLMGAGLKLFKNIASRAERKVYSQYGYKGLERLLPDDKGFIPNETWTKERLHDYRKKQDKKLARSDYNYDKGDKLYPKDKDFVDNPTWTTTRRNDYYRKDRLKRSQYNYKGADKLMPNDSDFINNATWTALLLSDYHANHPSHSHDTSSYHDTSSSSSWSSDSWSGGGFDGGGFGGSW